MKINRFILVFGVILLGLIATSLAEEMPFIGYTCDIDIDCVEWSEELLSFGEIDKPYPFCDVTTQTCHDSGDPASLELPSSTTIPNTQTTPATNQTTNASTANITINAAVVQSAALNSQVTDLKKEIAELKLSINSLGSTDGVFEQQLVGLNSELQSLSGSLNSLKQVQGEVNVIAVGLAGLQQNLENTTSEVAAIEANLAKKAARNKTIGIFSLILLVLLVFGALSYYMVGKKRPFGKVDNKIVTYITSYIKQGWKYPHIKEKLMKSGWSEGEIQWAYKETIKNNYKTYKQKKLSFESPSSQKNSKKESVGGDKNKMITIAVVSVLLVIGALLILNGTTGQAIFFQKTNTDGEIGYKFECTGNHTLNPDKDGCCLDKDKTGGCDYIEAQEQSIEKVSSGAACVDSFQCQQNEYCISGSCQTLASQYKGFGDCSKQCNTYAARIKTNDGETYPVKPGQGSYTSAGAIEWKILDGPTHCKGEPAFIPIRVTRKDVNGIINQEHFALKQGETSKVITHPTVPTSFTLKVDRIFEWCPE
jgi:hypothetical protein